MENALINVSLVKLCNYIKEIKFALKIVKKIHVNAKIAAINFVLSENSIPSLNIAKKMIECTLNLELLDL